MINKIKILLFAYFVYSGSLFACTNCDIPVANAGEDKTYFIGSTVILDGSGSYDAEGADLTYVWSSEYFSSACDLLTSSFVSTTCSLASESLIGEECSGWYSSLEIDDLELLNSCEAEGNPSSFVENVCNEILGVENLQSDCYENGIEAAFYNACDSSVYSQWLDCTEFSSDPPPIGGELFGVSPTFELNDEPGVATISLVVNDGDYDSDPDQVVITITDVNTPPVIDVLTSFEVNKNSEFAIDASGSYDETLHSEAMQYTWTYPSFLLADNQVDGLSSIILISPSVSVDTEFQITLSVTDGVDTTNETIFVNVIANIKPFSVPGEDLTIGAGAIFSLDATSSYDPDGSINTYLWTLPDGITSADIINGGSVNDAVIDVLAPSQVGEYIFTLDVTDDGGDVSDSYTGSQLYITEYFEPKSGFNSNIKYIEIYNPTGSPIDLSQYELWYISSFAGSEDWSESAESKLMFNHSASFVDNGISSSNLAEVTIDPLGPGEILVVGKNAQTFSESGVSVDNSVLWNKLNHSGDDAVAIYFNGDGSIIDAVGEPYTNNGANDPGNYWTVGDEDIGTRDVQLIRKPSFNLGNQNWLESAGTNSDNSEWLAYKDDETIDLSRMGSHYCSICDNQVTVTVTNNLAPTSAIVEDDFSVYSGSTIFLDGSISTDPENSNLTYIWTSDYNGLEIENSNTSNMSFIVPSDAPDGTQIVFSLEVSDGVSSDIASVTLTVETTNEPPIIVAEVEKMNFDGDDVVYNNEVYEDYTVYLNASDSQDNNSSTGILTYNWSVPALDYNNDGENDIVFSDSSSPSPTFEIGKYYGTNRTYEITLEVSDGDMTSTEVLNVQMVARMPIISIDTPTLTGYENEYVRMEALSTSDPNGLIDDLEFDWPGTSTSSNNEIFGVCTNNDQIYDNSGNLLGSENYSSADYCDVNGDCSLGTCSRKKAVAFRYLGTSIAENTDYDISVKVEDDDDYESESGDIVITSVARYPVANAGYDKTYVAGEDVYLFGQMSHDPQETRTTFSYWADNETWQTGESVGALAFYNETLVCSDDMQTICANDDDCFGADCIVKITAKTGYTFTWSQDAGNDIIISDEVFDQIKNDVNPCLTCLLDDGFTHDDLEGDCSLNFSGEYNPNEVELEFELTITDNTECGVNCSGGSGPDDTGVSLLSSNSTDVTITILQNCQPVADAGKNIIYNRNKSQEIEEYTSSFRAHTGYEYTLDGSNSSDSTPLGELNYLWKVRGYCPDSYTDFSECEEASVSLSDDTVVDPYFTVPTDLCIPDMESITEKSCCENNGGVWGNEGACDLDDIWIDDGKTLTITLEVNDGFLTSEEDTITVTYNAYSIPSQPILYATGTHFEGDENGTINLFWENSAEGSIDALTQYADFQGYKVFRSEDYGETWGMPKVIVDGEILAWEPFDQFDMSAEQDSTFCLYKNDNKDCGFDSNGNLLSAAELNRYNEVSGIVDWVDGFAWQDLGSNVGLSQTLIDDDVFDGVDYTYTVTAYDRGVRPDTLLYGHYGKLNGTTWDADAWVVNKPLYTFHDTMEADTFFLYNLNHEIIKSMVIGPDTDLNPSDSEDDPNVEVNGKEVLQNTHYFVLLPPDEWNVGQENESVSANDITEGVTVGWETQRGAPITNPHGYPAKESLESSLGASIDDRNFVTVSSDYYATNITFPSDDSLDDFIAANCKAVGNGDKFYQIVNEDELDASLVKFEIQADLNNYDNDGNGEVDAPPFEGYAMENACLYAYRVKENLYNNAPTDYSPLALEGEDIVHSLSGCTLSDCSDCYLEEAGDLSEYEGLPGVSIDCLNQEITIPSYLVDCHPLSSIDDANFEGNWTPFFNGIRMRFDNAIRNLPGDFVAPIDEIYSEPDTNLVYYLNRDDDLYGSIDLLYLGDNFANKPAYDYELEFSETYIDTAWKSTTDLNSGPSAACGRSFSTLLPFKVKNLTTGEYVKVLHSDDGIWNGIATEVPGWFDDTQDHPGDGDCVWSPGEWLTFQLDPVKIGDSEEVSNQKTFKLQLSYNRIAIYASKAYTCNGGIILDDYDQGITYPANTCVESEGLVWRASVAVSPQDGYIPNQWYDDDDPLTEINANPWKPVYPWNEGDKIIIKPKRWFVDGDYWITDMSLLGKAEEITEESLDDITVVPNPYIVNSMYNESTTLKQINFMHLPDECTISIYTISGELVDVIHHGPASIKGSITWDLRNKNGKLIAPGLYVYKVETPNGLMKVNKFAIIR